MGTLDGIAPGSASRLSGREGGALRLLPRAHRKVADVLQHAGGLTAERVLRLPHQAEARSRCDHLRPPVVHRGAELDPVDVEHLDLSLIHISEPTRRTPI